jgi:hypothetical protein
MATESRLEWFTTQEKCPPTYEPLLMIVSAAGRPPNVQLMGKCEVVTGYWDGDRYHPVTWEPERSEIDFDVRCWAILQTVLPEGIELQSPFRR